MKKLFENWNRYLNEDSNMQAMFDAAMKTIFSKTREIKSGGGKEEYPLAAIAQDAGVPLQALQTTEFKVYLHQRGFTPPEDITDANATVFIAETKTLKEEAVPHSAHHIVKKMKKTGKSAKETLKSLTTDLSDEEAERWLKRHKDEMESARQDLDEAAYEPGRAVSDIEASMDEPEQSYDSTELSLEESDRYVEALKQVTKAVEAGALPESVEDALFEMLSKLGIYL